MIKFKKYQLKFCLMFFNNTYEQNYKVCYEKNKKISQIKKV